MPDPVLTVLANGSVVFGCAETQHLELRTVSGGIRRINLPVERVPRTALELQQRHQQYVERMQRDVPGWKATANDIPDHHPAFGRMFAGVDGSLWVRVARPSVPCAADERCAWRNRYAYIRTDSLGANPQSIEIPPEISQRVDPVFAADAVFAVWTEPDGNERVARLRIITP